MKTLLLGLSAILMIQHNACCQDVITKRNGNGDTIKAKVLRVLTGKVEYKEPGNADTSSHFLPKSDIDVITYENGVRDTFNIAHNTANSGGIKYHDDNVTLAQRGTMDATRYYKGYRGAMIGTAIATLDFGYGLIPAIVCSLSPPKYNNLNVPYPELMDKQEYRDAYMRKAYKIKQERVWEGFGVGAAALAVILVFSLGVTPH